ncbi:MAG: glycosyltransferase family 2 protein [Gammaproteobacteria bacterium]
MNSPHLLPVSIIIPNFNYAHYLDACVISIIKQKYKVQEIIIIDDGSTDDTKQVVKAINNISEKYTIQYFYQENKGVSSARNYGYSVASSKYLFFLDADDVLLPNALEILYSTIKNNADSDMIFGGYIAYSHAGKKRKRIPESLSPNKTNNVAKLLNGNMVGLRPSSTIIKRAVMDEILFLDDVHIGEDTLFFTQVLFNKDCVAIPEAIVEMQRHHDSLRENYQRMIETGTNGIKQVFSLLPKTQQMEDLQLKQILNCYLRIGKMAYTEKDYPVASKYYSKAFKVQPKLLLRWKHLYKAIISIIKH